jgi:hypothetical protein
MPPYEKPKTSYDFITKPPTTQKTASSVKQKLPLITGGSVALLITLFIILSLFSGSPSNKDTLLKISQQQTEIARVAVLGTKDADQTTKNIAYNVNFSLSSDKAKLLQALAQNGVTFKDKETAAGANPKTDELLDSALAASNFDETFLKIVDTGLADYQATLEDAHKNTKNEAIKKSLVESYKHSELLRTQITSAQ